LPAILAKKWQKTEREMVHIAKLIQHEFGISEKWLLEGDMLIDSAQEKSVDVQKLVGDIVAESSPSYEKKWDQYIKEKRKKEYRASCQLKLVSSRWSEDYGYATYEGQVKNISGIKLKNVQAVVTWYDRNDNMITSSGALIEYNPILPGQSSPFKVMKTYNPAMQKAAVEFSHLMGGTIRTYREK
jgi:hypothetical protein